MNRPAPQTTADARRAENAADRAETALQRQRRESSAARGSAPPLPGVPKESVGLPQSYWGDRQRGEVQEMLTLLPIIESVALATPLPEAPENLNEEQRIDFALNARMTMLMKARKLVVERLRKEI